MLGSTILDVAIGLVFIFLLSSLIASAIREGIEAWTKTRASQLEAGLREILRDKDGKDLVRQFYDHPLISSLYPGSYGDKPRGILGRILFRGSNLPSYIPSRNFALALMDMAGRGPEVDASQGTAPVTLDSIRNNIGTIQNPFVQRALLIALDRANGDIQAAQLNLEAWYDSAMDRVSGWYKRITQWILIAIGIVLAVALNINSLKIATTLFHDKTSRDLLVDSATKFNEGHKDAANLPGYTEAMKQLDILNLPIGWVGEKCLVAPDANTSNAPGQRPHETETSPGCTGKIIPAEYAVSSWTAGIWGENIAGWLITAFAISMGAPFWFDWLNKLIVVRSTVKPHQKSPEEPSQEGATDTPETAASEAAATGAPGKPVVGGPPAAPQVLVPSPQQSAPVAGLEPDGCDVAVEPSDITTDQELPMAKGGVER